MTWLHIFDIVYRASFLGQVLVQGRVGVAADVLLVTYIFSFHSVWSTTQYYTDDEVSLAGHPIVRRMFSGLEEFFPEYLSICYILARQAKCVIRESYTFNEPENVRLCYQ